MALNPKTKWPAQIAVNDAAYPYGKARNVGTGGDGSGTPFDADLVNDNFGFHQALLQEVGALPSGTPDNVDSSQYLDAIKALIARLPQQDLVFTGQNHIYEDFYYVSPVTFGRVIPLACGRPDGTAIAYQGDAWKWTSGTVSSKLYFPLDFPAGCEMLDVKIMLQGGSNTHTYTAAVESYQPDLGTTAPIAVVQRQVVDGTLSGTVQTKSLPQFGTQSQALARTVRAHQLRVQIDNYNTSYLAPSYLRGIYVLYLLPGPRAA